MTVIPTRARTPTQTNSTTNSNPPSLSLPHNLHYEQSIIAILLTVPDSLEALDGILNEAAFSSGRHRLMYRGIEDLSRRNIPYDPMTLETWLTDRSLMSDAGSTEYLLSLLQNAPAAYYNLPAYAARVQELAVLRDLIRIGHDILQTAHDPQGQSVPDILDRIETDLHRLNDAQTTRGTGPQDAKTLLTKVIHTVETLQRQEGSLIGYPTGFSSLDRETLGLQRQDLIIVAARPSMGKTTLAMNLVFNLIRQTGLPGLIFSMEMPAEQIMTRHIAAYASIPFSSLRSGQLNESEWIKLTQAMSTLQHMPIEIDDTAALSPAELRARARRIAKKYGGQLGVIMVDYLQLMRVPGMGHQRVQEISEISRALKALAKEMNCPVIALSQLNRALENRPNKRPIMSDLRESGAIEQDADLITFIYRDEVYHPDAKDQGTAEIIIGKQRNGPIGTVRLAFQGQYARFCNLSPDG